MWVTVGNLADTANHKHSGMVALVADCSMRSTCVTKQTILNDMLGYFFLIVSSYAHYMDLLASEPSSFQANFSTYPKIKLRDSPQTSPLQNGRNGHAYWTPWHTQPPPSPHQRMLTTRSTSFTQISTPHAKRSWRRKAMLLDSMPSGGLRSARSWHVTQERLDQWKNIPCSPPNSRGSFKPPSNGGQTNTSHLLAYGKSQPGETGTSPYTSLLYRTWMEWCIPIMCLWLKCSQSASSHKNKTLYLPTSQTIPPPLHTQTGLSLKGGRTGETA